jgi:Fe2+ or Zn2+ uptake regulation protein
MKVLEGSGSTKQRQVVLRVIRESEEHLTANEVFEGARQLLPGISFATVYNSLRFLKNEGLIGEIRFGMDATRYDRKLTRHDHAICTECGKTRGHGPFDPAKTDQRGRRTLAVPGKFS